MSILNSDVLRTIKRKYRVDTSQISFLKFILEAYDGMVQLTTLKPASGLIEIHVAAGYWKDFEMIIMNLKKQMLIEILEHPQENSDYQ